MDKQEPVAWMYRDQSGHPNCYAYQLPDWSPLKASEIPLYTRANRPADDGLAARLEALAAKATPGEWGVVSRSGLGLIGAGRTPSEKRECVVAQVEDPDGDEPYLLGENDAALIVELVNNLPAILTALKACANGGFLPESTD